MTREEHIKWCKDRAMAYVRRGELANAVTSMLSDLRKGEYAQKVSPHLEMFGMSAVARGDQQDVERFILGFH